MWHWITYKRWYAVIHNQPTNQLTSRPRLSYNYKPCVLYFLLQNIMELKHMEDVHQFFFHLAVNKLITDKTQNI